MKTLSNTGFTEQTFKLTPFKGQTIRIQLEAVKDGASLTSFVVDDFAVVIES